MSDLKREADAAFDKWFKVWFGRYPSDGQAADMRLAYTQCYYSLKDKLDKRGDDDIHKMMDRAHQAEIREARLRIEINRLQAELDALRAALHQIGFLDHNEREWESIAEVKAFALAALAGSGDSRFAKRESATDQPAGSQPK